MTWRIIIIMVLGVGPALAHDSWVETNSHLVRSGDAVHIDLKLGNHGNDHRDFKLASKIDAKDCAIQVLAPEGKKYDLRAGLSDLGYAPKEGYWSGKFVAAQPGLYTVVHTSDRVVSYAPTRSIKSAKAMFVVSDSLDKIARDQTGFDKSLGHALEIVPTTNPVVPMGPGQPINVQVLYQGKPWSGAKVSFIPRGESLEEGFDAEFERTTDAQGLASFTPRTGNVYLVVTHRQEPEASGEGYENTKYSATLVVYVPEICPCCNE
ncbi:MAG: DUF4198 domain-containing protein [Planctomycetaceae bacterium]|nr:DUF4198 domain-containing protein [Planctomycetaceae bacterium]MCB9938106.1 DUF4198 domain-containing protein [Planctomycetaceae bacterium]